jgi:hypothetical protein
VSKHQLRLLVCAGAAVVLIVASVLVLDWFKAKVAIGIANLDWLSIDLRTVRECTPDRVCLSVPLAKLPGPFATFAPITFWTSIALGALLLFQAGTRLVGGTASERLTRIGYGLGLITLFNALGAGYVFAPDGMQISDMATVTFTRTWGPAMLVAASLLALVAMSLAVAEETIDDNAGAYRPISKSSISQGGSGVGLTPYVREVPPVVARTKTPQQVPAIARTKTPSVAPVATRARVPDEIPFTPDSEPEPGADASASTAQAPFVSTAPSSVARVAAAITQESLRKKLAYATATVTIEETGLQCRREDDLVKRVRWRDIVGVVARRLPAGPPYEGVTFLDVVSEPGATLRILPWTKLTGASFEHQGDLRAREIVQLLQARCPTLHVDPATRAFLGGDLAAQLPDDATLAAHDRRLA